MDKFLGRPATAPPKVALRGDSLDEAKKTWDRIRFGQQTADIKGAFFLLSLAV